MKRLLVLVALFAPALAGAALPADAVLVAGQGWRRVLPVYAAAARPGRDRAAARLPAVILVAPGEERWTEELLARLRPRRVVTVGPRDSFPELKIPGEVRHVEDAGAALLAAAFAEDDRAPAVYVSDGKDFAAALAGAALAASEQAPLLVVQGDPLATAREAGALARRLHAGEIVLLGRGDVEALQAAAQLPVRPMGADAALVAYGRKVQGTRHLVVTAPSDAEGPFRPPHLSLLSVPYALARGALLTYAGAGAGGGRTTDEAVIDLERAGWGPLDVVTAVGDYLALPMRQVLDVDQVARGKRNPRQHRIPPFVSPEGRPVDRASGRLATLDAYDLSRWVARLTQPGLRRGDARGAVVMANADHKFVLGEAISRSTVEELENAGVAVEFFHGDEIDRALVKRALPGHRLVLWEGHPRDLTLDDDALPAPEDALPPATFFLQGCYTLDRSDPFVLIERGADAVIGTYMAVYSASGSGFARALLSAQLHQGKTAGEAMVSARNFLLAVVELKKRRGHGDFRKTLRAALSFDLWGDPTAKLPVRSRAPELPPVTARVEGDEVLVRVPARALPTVEAGPYQATVRPGAQLSALYLRQTDDADAKHRLAELFFAEVRLPERFGDAPRLEGDVPPATYAWVFSPRTRVLSILVHEQALGAGNAGTVKLTVRP